MAGMNASQSSITPTVVAEFSTTGASSMAAFTSSAPAVSPASAVMQQLQINEDFLLQNAEFIRQLKLNQERETRLKEVQASLFQTPLVAHAAVPPYEVSSVPRSSPSMRLSSLLIPENMLERVNYK